MATYGDSGLSDKSALVGAIAFVLGVVSLVFGLHVAPSIPWYLQLIMVAVTLGLFAVGGIGLVGHDSRRRERKRAEWEARMKALQEDFEEEPEEKAPKKIIKKSEPSWAEKWADAHKGGK